MRLGLDRDDGVVREHLIQKMLLLAEDLGGASREPTRDEAAAPTSSGRATGGAHDERVHLVHVFATRRRDRRGSRRRRAGFRRSATPTARLRSARRSRELATSTEAARTSRRPTASRSPTRSSRCPRARGATPVESRFGWHLVKVAAVTSPERSRRSTTCTTASASSTRSSGGTRRSHGSSSRRSAATTSTSTAPRCSRYGRRGGSRCDPRPRRRTERMRRLLFVLCALSSLFAARARVGARDAHGVRRDRRAAAGTRDRAPAARRARIPRSTLEAEPGCALERAGDSRVRVRSRVAPRLRRRAAGRALTLRGLGPDRHATPSSGSPSPMGRRLRASSRRGEPTLRAPERGVGLDGGAPVRAPGRRSTSSPATTTCSFWRCSCCS